MSGILLVLVIVAGLLFLWMIAWGIFWFLVQAGVIVQKALEPPAMDDGSYTLSQGREVKTEDK
ncbi:MAG: hypothetical protein OHK0015_22340 [Chloroflexi bacterium OHK40]